MERVKPITPEEAIALHKIPNEIFSAINELIKEKFDGIRAHIKVDEIFDRLNLDGMHITRATAFNNHYLDVEDHYREAGWIVRYEQPSYGDTDFDAYFEFKVK